VRHEIRSPCTCPRLPGGCERPHKPTGREDPPPRGHLPRQFANRTTPDMGKLNHEISTKPIFLWKIIFDRYARSSTSISYPLFLSPVERKREEHRPRRPHLHWLRSPVSLQQPGVSRPPPQQRLPRRDANGHAAQKEEQCHILQGIKAGDRLLRAMKEERRKRIQSDGTKRKTELLMKLTRAKRVS
jgi:hypothetical protein